MNDNRRLWYGIAALVLVLGFIGAGVATVLSVRADLPSVLKAFAEPTQYVSVPGSGELKLARSGAYAVYFQSSYRPTDRPPALTCSLTSKTTGQSISLADDFVPTNMNVRVGGRQLGVLIYSATIKDPGVYSVACRSIGGQLGSNASVAVGPNYVFEFLRGAWSVARSVLIGLALVFAASLLSLFVVVLALLQSRARSRAAVAAA